MLSNDTIIRHSVAAAMRTFSNDDITFTTHSARFLRFLVKRRRCWNDGFSQTTGPSSQSLPQKRPVALLHRDQSHPWNHFHLLKARHYRFDNRFALEEVPTWISATCIATDRQRYSLDPVFTPPRPHVNPTNILLAASISASHDNHGRKLSCFTLSRNDMSARPRRYECDVVLDSNPTESATPALYARTHSRNPQWTRIWSSERLSRNIVEKMP